MKTKGLTWSIYLADVSNCHRKSRVRLATRFWRSSPWIFCDLLSFQWFSFLSSKLEILILTSSVKQWNVPHFKLIFRRYKVKKARKRVSIMQWTIIKKNKVTTGRKRKRKKLGKRKPCWPMKYQEVHYLENVKTKSDISLGNNLSEPEQWIRLSGHTSHLNNYNTLTSWQLSL